MSEVDWKRIDPDIRPRRALIEIESELCKPQPDIDRCKRTIRDVLPPDEKGA